MSVVANVITPQGLEPFQIPTKIRSPSDYLVYGGHLVLHLRDPHVIPSAGVSVRVDAARYDDRDSDLFDFTRVVGDVQAQIPLGYRNRILALRVRSSNSVGEGQRLAAFIGTRSSRKENWRRISSQRASDTAPSETERVCRPSDSMAAGRTTAPPARSVRNLRRDRGTPMATLHS